jgi:hypothetical protein
MTTSPGCEMKKIATIAILVLAASACERFERAAARELYRLVRLHEALLEEAARAYLDLQDRGKPEDAETLRRAVLTIDAKLRTIEREASVILLSYLSHPTDDGKRELQEKLALILELLGDLSEAIR